MKKAKYYFYVYATGHGYPSVPIMHVGYSQQSKSYDYTAWFSKSPVTLEQAEEIDKKLSHYNGTRWTMINEQIVRNLINEYIDELTK